MVPVESQLHEIFHSGPDEPSFVRAYFILTGNANIKFQRIKEKLLQELSKIVKEVRNICLTYQ